MTSLWHRAQLICPLCQQSLVAAYPADSKSQISTMSCENRHSFDIGKSGYLHLIPVQNKRSKEPGDNKDMIAARKRFLSKGYYQPISFALNTIITQTMNKPSSDKMISPQQFLDLGCGEGYYTARLKEQINPEHFLLYGMDISKAAIQQAAKRSKDIIWLVANNKQIPIPDQSVDLIFSVFSPIIPKECHRILKPQGLLITATTESKHLLSLRSLIYEEVRDYDNEKLEKQLSSHFNHQAKEVIRHSLSLTQPEDVLDLLQMTPHYWRTNTDKRKQLTALSSLETELVVQLQVFAPRS